MIRFLAEITESQVSEVHLTPSNSRDGLINRQNNIYELYIGKYPEESYWLDWGGHYDNYSATQLELYFGQFLLPVNNINELIDTPYSLLVMPDLMVLVNLPKHPWLYSEYSVDIENVTPFLSAPLNSDNPILNILRGRNAKVRLGIPSLSRKLSDNINGIVLNQGMSFQFINNDGFFDNEDYWKLFNTPVHLKKAIVENPKYEDFKTIWRGLVEDTSSTFDSFNIKASDYLKAMDNPVCDIITQENFFITLNENIINKKIPIVYGKKHIELLKLNDTMYLAAEYVTEVHSIVNDDGENISFTFNPVTGIITIPELTIIDEETGKEEVLNTEPDIAVITGYENNKISEIIKDLIGRKTNIRFNDSNWDINEYERYNDDAYRINILIDNNSVKDAIQNVLKNDMAYFFQKNDGRFTIRKYGTEYNTHEISSWLTTNKPNKSFLRARENYFSSCIISYDNGNGGVNSFLYNQREREAEKEYRRIVRKSFETNLYNEENVAELASMLSDRFTTIKQTLTVPVGFDVSSYELLDWIIYNADINNRKFSRGEIFIIKEIDPAQDILTLEDLEMYDITGEYPDSDDYEYDVNGQYADTVDEEYLYNINGGGQ